MRRRLIVLLLVLLPLPVFAASGLFVGVEAGYNYDIIDTATGWAGTQNSNGHGFDISVPVEYRVNDWFSVNSGLRWIMRSSGYRKSYSEAGDKFVVDDYVKMHHAIEIPFTVRFALPLDDFRLFIGGGGYIGVRTLDVDAGSSYLTASDAEERGYWESYYQHIAFEADDNLFDAGLGRPVELHSGEQRHGAQRRTYHARPAADAVGEEVLGAVIGQDGLVKVVDVYYLHHISPVSR